MNFLSFFQEEESKRESALTDEDWKVIEEAFEKHVPVDSLNKEVSTPKYPLLRLTLI